MLNGNFDFNDENSLKSCNQIVVPPRNIDVAKNVCNKPEISVCNKPGYWRNFNKSIAQACKAFKQPFTAEYFAVKYVYRNVFCAMCNEQNANQYGTEHVYQPKNLRARGFDEKFMGLLNWRFYKEVDTGTDQDSNQRPLELSNASYHIIVKQLQGQFFCF